MSEDPASKIPESIKCVIVGDGAVGKCYGSFYNFICGIEVTRQLLKTFIMT